MAFSRLGHKAMLTRLSAASFRRSVVIVGRFFSWRSAHCRLVINCEARLWWY